MGRRGGGLSGVHAVDLSAHVLRALAERTGIDPAVVDDVIWGCVSQVGEQAFNVGRNAVLAAGWPESVPGTTHRPAVRLVPAGAALRRRDVLSGQADVVVAGGVESMSRVPMGRRSATASTGRPLGPPFDGPVRRGRPFNQGVGAEMIAERWGFSRDPARRVRAGLAREGGQGPQDDGAFDAEIAPVDDAATVRSPPTRASGPAARWRSSARAEDPVQAGRRRHRRHRQQISDGAAALLVTTCEKARELGLTPLVRVHTAVMAATTR